MCPFDMDDGLFMRLTVGTTPASVLVAAPKRANSFDTAERVKFMSALIPHLQQALRTQDHLLELGGNSAGDITGVIDAVRHGIVIVGTKRACRAPQLRSPANPDVRGRVMHPLRQRGGDPHVDRHRTSGQHRGCVCRAAELFSSRRFVRV
jgi:hypothetical protein